MLNDIRPPPVEPNDPTVNGRHHLRPHSNDKEPGTHHSRYLGDIPTTDPLYSMPFEERGSGFNIAMSVVALLLFGTLIVAAWWTLG